MSTMQIDLTGLGRWTRERRFVFDRARAVAYAAAVNDDNPLHVSGIATHPVFAAAPIVEHIAEAVDGLIPPELRRWGVHGAQDMYFHRPLVPGDAVTSRAAIVGVFPRIGGVTAVVIKTESRLDDGVLATEGYVSLYFRRRYEGKGVGETAPEHRTPAGLRADAEAAGTARMVVYAIDADQTYRYAAASGDDNPIHLDDVFARSVGLPGIIVHGMCTLALATRVVVAHAAGGDSRRIRRLAVRFARPVLPGQTITTRLWPAGARDDAHLYAFETSNPDGKAVLLDGLAAVSG